MSLQKFRGVDEMPPLPPVTGLDLARRIRAVWNRSRLFAPTLPLVRGLQRFRSIEEAQAARDKHQAER